MIEKYAGGGGDGGLSERLLRRACGLPPRPRVRESATDILTRLAEMDDPIDFRDSNMGYDVEGQLIPVLTHLAGYLLKDNKEFITSAMFKYVPPPKQWTDQNFHRDDIWSALHDHGLLNSTSSRGKGTDKKVPSMRPKKPVSALVSDRVLLSPTARDTVLQREFTEVADIQALKVYFTSETRRHNVSVMDGYLKETLKDMSMARRRGRPDGTTQAVHEHFESEIRKLKDSEAQLLSLLSTARSASTTTQSHASSTGTPKRRRLRPVQSDEELLNYSVTYSFTRDDIRTRRQASSPSAQRCSQVHQKILFPNTHDLDIHNCCFTILCHVLHVTDPELINAADVAFLRRLRDNRGDVCAELGVSEARGKMLLNKVFNGGAIPEDMQGNAILRGLQRLARCMRWLTVDLIPDVCDAVSEDVACEHDMQQTHALSLACQACNCAIQPGSGASCDVMDIQSV